MRTFDIKLENGPASPAKTGWHAARRALLGCALVLFSHSVYGASSIGLLALFGDKALLHIDGTQRVLQTGETSPEGVTLVGVESEHAVVEVNGKEEVLDLNSIAAFPGSEAVPEDSSYQGPQKVSLWADASGFFYSNGMIDGFPVRFLVDTGATSIAVSSQLADRIGIDYADSQRGLANTAGGVTPMYRVSLEKVSVGGITLRNVDAGVVVGSFPRVPLLGMSFLGQLDMVREGNRMDLKRRL